MGNRQGQQSHVLMVGLDGAGKTTMIYKLKLGPEGGVPSIRGTKTMEYKNIRLTSWDVGGQEKVRVLWRHFYKDVSAVVFVVDSNDAERIQQAGEELARMLNEDELRDVALLVFANKQDLPSSLSPEEVAEHMGLLRNECLTNRRWGVQGSSAIHSDGLHEGLDWLADLLAGNHAYHSPRIMAESFGVIDKPERIITTRPVVVFAKPGCHIKAGILDADSSIDIVEVVAPSKELALAYGRIEAPVEGWIALHSGQVRANHFVVSLCCTPCEQGKVSVSCHSMAGEELTNIDLQASELKEQTMADLRQVIAKRIKKDQMCLKLVKMDGTLLVRQDDGKSLAAALTDAANEVSSKGTTGPCTIS